MPAAIEHIAITDAHGIHEQAVAHGAAVYEPELLIRLGARNGRQPDPSGNRNRPGRMMNRHRAREELVTEHAANARIAGASGDVEHFAAFDGRRRVEQHSRTALHLEGYV